jgi:hypothetical protein
MKTTLALITTLLISQNAIARDCETKVEINVYSSQVGMPAPQSVSLDDSKRIGRIAKAMEQVGYQITENNDPALTAKIEAGIERGEEQSELFSHVQIISRKGKVLFDGYKNRKIAKDKEKDLEEISAFIKRHLKNDLPICQ